MSFILLSSSVSSRFSNAVLTHPSSDRHGIPLRPVNISYLVQGTGHTVRSTFGARGGTVELLWPCALRTSAVLSARDNFVAVARLDGVSFLSVSCITLPLWCLLLRSSRSWASVSPGETVHYSVSLTRVVSQILHPKVSERQTLIV
jgi:hypothetical protein